MIARVCAWCRQLLDPTARRDAKFCSQSCRQASHRFQRAVAHDVRHDGSTPMRFAYADPPYPGLSRRYYGDHPDFDGEVDHEELIARLSSPGRYDGWALSTSADALAYVLSLCAGETRRVRVAAWFRGGRARRAARGPLSSWEPVVFSGGRDGSQRFDALTHVARPRTTDPDRVIGAKPAVFARWMFDLLGAQPGDTLDDLYPGSGGIARAWDVFTSCGSPSDVSLVDDGHDSACRAGPSDTSRCAAAPHDASREYSDDASPRNSATDEPSARASHDTTAGAS